MIASPTRRLLLCLGVTLGSVGCGPHLRTPNWFDPGNAASQRFDAIYHDPYPMTDTAPEIVGGRPREYQAPVPPVARPRLQQQLPTIAPAR
ncbi:MAG: hypothetical protein AAF266_11675 [Planctomycetota bacterium]